MTHGVQCLCIDILRLYFVCFQCKAFHLLCRKNAVCGPMVLVLEELGRTDLSITAQSGITNVNLRLN